MWVRMPKDSGVQTFCHRVIEGRKRASQEIASGGHRAPRANPDRIWVVEPEMVLQKVPLSRYLRDPSSQTLSVEESEEEFN